MKTSGMDRFDDLFSSLVNLPPQSLNFLRAAPRELEENDARLARPSVKACVKKQRCVIVRDHFNAEDAEVFAKERIF
jgi:hypothetical protein